jgi:hypothetical protein
MLEFQQCLVVYRQILIQDRDRAPLHIDEAL